MGNAPEPLVGEIWDLNFDPQVGREQAGVRPALVISTNRFNRLPNGLHIVVPITGTDRGLPFHVAIQPPEGGLTKYSFAMCDQVKSLSIRRFVRRRGQVEPETLDDVQSITARLIGR